MDEDTEQAAFAQTECEARQYHYLLASDLGYLAWLEQFSQEVEEHESYCEG